MKRTEGLLVFICVLLLFAGLIYIQQTLLSIVIVMSNLTLVAAGVRARGIEVAWVPFRSLRLLLLLGFSGVLAAALILQQPALQTHGTTATVGQVLIDYGEGSIFLLFAMVLIGISIPSWDKS